MVDTAQQLALSYLHIKTDFIACSGHSHSLTGHLT